MKKNFRTPFGEADIVAEKDGYICFVEVKTRSGDSFGLPAEAVTRDKQNRYRKIAGYYMAGVGEEVAVRFDVASILDGEIEYIENAFM